MKKNKTFLKVLSCVLALLTLLAVIPVTAIAEGGSENNEGASHALVVKSESLTVEKRKTIQMTASVTNVETQPKITWTTTNDSIATVDENGIVKGVEVGEVVILATAYVNGVKLQGEFKIDVIKRSNFLKDFLVNKQVLSYQYSYKDDFYYTNDKDCWQYNFGFGRIYDIASPYILLEYDYIRVFFTHEGKDWMLQMWKGQYGMIFYGGEIGIYNRPHSDDKEVGDWTMYNCPAEEDWLNMEMTLYHQESNGTWTREFTREYGKYWWCTGFKNGHVRKEEPCNELRLVGRITFKDEQMAELVRDGLEECGFKEATSKSKIGLDEMYVEGCDISFIWQNISEAENTMPIKYGLGFISTLATMPYWPLIFPFVWGFLVVAQLVSVIL